MHSFQMLTKLTGNPIWSDRCEEIALNTFPAAMTPDAKGLHYITCANQVQLDRNDKSPGIQNSGTMFSFSPFEVYRCCQHNVSHGWPYYAEELWLATPDNGLCASLYAASEVHAKVGSGDGQAVTITQETDYPFGEIVTLKLVTAEPVQFPLYLRVPRWCESVSVAINDQQQSVSARPLTYLVLKRQWKTGDTVTLQLPMKVTLRTWEKNQRSVSIDRGPLSYSLAIRERWQKYGDRSASWPEWEVFADSAWNYGLEIGDRSPAELFEVVRKPESVPPQPFTPDTVPIQLKARARKIANWQLDHLGMVGKLQPSPARTSAPLEEITLIPMGAARLRITAFPTVTSTGGHEWTASQ
jgi:hypothetical protein